jgi:predicted XRE-type DNA-binding protein
MTDMSMTDTRSWGEVKAAAARSGALSEARRNQAAKRTEEYVQAYRLTEIRQSRRLTQVQLAQAMHVTQPRVSEIEHGTLDGVQLATLRKYVQALGGHLTITADFDDDKITLATT